MKTALVAYVPVLHAGYVQFFKKYAGGGEKEAKLFILGRDFLSELPRIERDIRALSPEEAKEATNALGIFSEVLVMDKKNISGAALCRLVMPDEDIMHTIAEKYFAEKLTDGEIVFEDVFLRWDRFLPTKEMPPAADRKISKDDFDREIMKAAHDEAQKSSDWWRQIGALLIKDGKVILKTHNKHLPSESTPLFSGDPRSNFDAGEHIELSSVLHGEAGIIAEAARRGISLEGCSLYVTIFPCPNCAKLIAASGIKKVFYSKGYSLLDAENIFKTFEVELIKVEI